MLVMLSFILTGLIICLSILISGYFNDESIRTDGNVPPLPADLYYILYDYMPPSPDKMKLQYQQYEYPKPAVLAAAAVYDYIYPLYAMEKTKPDYAVSKHT